MGSGRRARERERDGYRRLRANDGTAGSKETNEGGVPEDVGAAEKRDVIDVLSWQASLVCGKKMPRIVGAASYLEDVCCHL